MYKTENCIICGKKATGAGGHIVARKRMALGNYVSVKVCAGFCDSCFELVESEAINSDENGCYGEYNSDLHGACVPLFAKQSR